MSRIGNLNRLIHTLAIRGTIHIICVTITSVSSISRFIYFSYRVRGFFCGRPDRIHRGLAWRFRQNQGHDIRLKDGVKLRLPPQHQQEDEGYTGLSRQGDGPPQYGVHLRWLRIAGRVVGYG